MNQAVTSNLTATAVAPVASAQQFLTFNLQNEVFGLDIMHVKEIIEYGHVTTVPLMPSFVRGVLNLRGSVVPVIDLGVRFWKRQTEVLRRTCIVIVEVVFDERSHDLGIVVDAVCEVLDVAGSDIEPPPAFGTRIRADFIKGMAKQNQRFVVLLDANHVLSLDEMASLVGDSSQALTQGLPDA